MDKIKQFVFFFKKVIVHSKTALLGVPSLISVEECNYLLNLVHRDVKKYGCYTGLRYSDFSSLNQSQFKEGFIEITQTKTGQPVAIPVHSVVKAILAKYKGNRPHSISNQKTNEYLKEIAKKIPSLQQTVTKSITKGGIMVVSSYKK